MDRSHIVTQPLTGTSDQIDATHDDEQARNNLLEGNPLLRHAIQTDQPDAECPEATIDLEGSTMYKGLEHYCDQDDDDHVEEIVFGSEPDGEESISTTHPAEVAERAVADDVDDLADYMQNFLQRMKCSNVVEIAENVEEVEPEVEDIPDEPAQSYSGPKPAPESVCDLQAMREVALASANDSLSRHDQMVVKKTQAAFLIALCLWITSAVVAFFATTVVGYAFVAAVVCGGTAAFFTSGYLLGLRKLRSSERPAQPVPNASTPKG